MFLDIFKTKEKKNKKAMTTENNNEDTVNFEEYLNAETYATFQQMNLSRPLLKV